MEYTKEFWKLPSEQRAAELRKRLKNENIHILWFWEAKKLVPEAFDSIYNYDTKSLKRKTENDLYEIIQDQKER